MKRRRTSVSRDRYFIPLILLILLNGSVMAWSQQADWSVYKERFLSPEGRIIDDGNHGVSHSEGQGYGLILAQINEDHEAFGRIWKWTQSNLRKRGDHLFAWRWAPAGSDGVGVVEDKNNATDGDLLIAWGLARAGAAWNNAEFQTSAREIAQDVRRTMVQPSRYGPILLPGGQGFVKPEGTVVNLSYWVFPAFRALAKIDPSLDWSRLEQSGLKLIEAARFSPLNLPPDWLLLGKSSVNLAKEFEAAYGYNAVRIPLYLVWGGIKAAKYYTGFRRVGTSLSNLSNGGPPAKVFLPSGSFDAEPALPGMDAIYRLIAGSGDIGLASVPAPYNGTSEGEKYYSVSLGLLSNRAAVESPNTSQ
jgi:endo-1,4-beta-D-glucanase Y